MRVLVATVPLTGHVQPMRHVVRELVARGHEVVWYGATKFASTIEGEGARFAPPRAAVDWDDDHPEDALFTATLENVLAADVTRWPERRLANELARAKAARYLAAIDRLIP